jgi:glycosyltransferase involved in cell wall biosynthesis
MREDFLPVIVVGDFSPTDSGLSVYNLWLTEFLQKSNYPSSKFDTSCAGNKFYFFTRALKYFQGCFVLLKVERNTTIYLSLSGGLSIIGQLLMVLPSHVRGSRLLVAHHSHKIINHPFGFLVNIIYRRILRKVEHVYLSQMMADSYCKIFGKPKKTWVLTNDDVARQRIDAAKKILSKEVTICHASRLSKEKGSLFVLNIALKVMKIYPDIKFVILGSTADLEINHFLNKLQIEYPKQFSYYPNYSLKTLSRELLRSGIFLFPSSYEHEASPGVVLESQMAGNLVLASDVGSLPDIVLAPGKAVPLKNFEFEFFELLESYRSNPATYLNAVMRNQDTMQKRAENSQKKLLEILQFNRT